MKFVLFYHSFVSCWNHGNAHFLRGVARALIQCGHKVTIYEPSNGWSRSNAVNEQDGPVILSECERLVPQVDVRSYALNSLDLDHALDHADVVMVHEWNDPTLIRRLGERRMAGAQFQLLFHDTHHRAVTAPQELERFELDAYDFILVFGEVLREVYGRRGWGRQAVVWHEAADAEMFRPKPAIGKDTDLIWIGNWGDGERDAELREFLLAPLARADLRARLHGVRYPDAVRDEIRARGIEYLGWLPNHRVPDAFAGARFTVHIPRRPYVEQLVGIPTIRMFEALACGIPLISAPWNDSEGLFPEGCFIKVANSTDAARAMQMIISDDELASELARKGRQAVLARHTCMHRVNELLALLHKSGQRDARHSLFLRARPEHRVVSCE